MQAETREVSIVCVSIQWNDEYFKSGQKDGKDSETRAVSNSKDSWPGRQNRFGIVDSHAKGLPVGS